MKKFFIKLLDFIYKKRCYFCKTAISNTIMCERCYAQIQFFANRYQKRLDNVKIYCATLYKDNTKKMIRALKYHNQTDLAYYQAKLMYEYWQRQEESENSYIIVPVPMHKSREKTRGYNHMTLVAQEFAKLAGENYVANTNLIKRIKNTKPQYKLTLKQRQQNLKNAFTLTEGYEKFINKKLLLIDDILTTGSTLHEMIQTFNAKGIYNICCLTTSCAEFRVTDIE